VLWRGGGQFVRSHQVMVILNRARTSQASPVRCNRGRAHEFQHAGLLKLLFVHRVEASTGDHGKLIAQVPPNRVDLSRVKSRGSICIDKMDESLF
jgi:hypothetical protein